MDPSHIKWKDPSNLKGVLLLLKEERFPLPKRIWYHYSVIKKHSALIWKDLPNEPCLVPFRQIYYSHLTWTSLLIRQAGIIPYCQQRCWITLKLGVSQRLSSQLILQQGYFPSSRELAYCYKLCDCSSSESILIHIENIKDKWHRWSLTVWKSMYKITWN